MQRTAVVLFARSPEREAAAKGMRSAAPLFRRVIESWLDTAQRAGATPLIACAEEDVAALSTIARHIPRKWITQRGVEFGERVVQVAEEALASFDAVVLAAIDAPPPATLTPVFDALARGATVIAPARDGGINFIAFTQLDRELLFDLTVARCRERVASLIALDATTDVDSRATLAIARSERAWRAFFTHRASTHVAPLSHASAPARCIGSRAPPERRLSAGRLTGF